MTNKVNEPSSEQWRRNSEVVLVEMKVSQLVHCAHRLH